MPKEPRVLVCVTVQKSCEHLIRAGAEFAKEIGAELSVVHVTKTGSNFLGSDSDGEALEYLFKISKAYDADMLLLRNDDVVRSIAAHARKVGATMVVMGGSLKKGGSHLSRSMQNALPDVEIRVLAGLDG